MACSPFRLSLILVLTGCGSESSTVEDMMFETMEQAEAHCLAASTAGWCNEATQAISDDGWGACVWSQSTPLQVRNGECVFGEPVGRCTYDGFFSEGCGSGSYVCAPEERQVYHDDARAQLVEAEFCQGPDNYPDSLAWCSEPTAPEACACACDLPPLG